jgi:dihydroflavonol-4-reductase
MTKSTKPLSLVTGACGFMGTHMVEVLAEAGHQIRATDLAECYQADDRKRGRFPSVLQKLGAEFIPSDLGRPETLAPLVKDVDYIFHIASVFNYTAPWSVLKKINVDGTKALWDYALQEKSLKRVVVWGAGGVYGLPDPEDLPLCEDTTPPAPCNNYLKSKWREEYLTMQYGREKGLKWTILRPTTVYGPRGVYGGGQMVMSAATMKISAMPKNFTARIPFIHAHDVCSAALYLADRKDAENQIFNTNDDSQMTTVEYFKYMADLMGHKFIELPAVPVSSLRNFALGAVDLVKILSSATGIPIPLERDPIEYVGRDFVYSNEKLHKTGYKFIYSDARDGLRDTVRWYQQEGWI